MTAAGAGPDYRTAAVIVEDALAMVFPADLVARLRPDSPLAGLGMTPADAVCVCDAVADVAGRAGLSCDLSDADLADADLDGPRTVGDLVGTVLRRLSSEGDG